MGPTRAVAATVGVCLAVLCMPAVSIAADPSDSSARSADRGSALLARGAGYGQPHGQPRVRALQRKLRVLGHRPGPIDGLYGPLTEAAVERLQHDSGLSVDGIVGPQTRRVLNADAPPLVPGAGYGQPGGSRQVREVQRRLRALGQRPGPVDGVYGPATRAAIARFQRAAALPANGVLSSTTAVELARTDTGAPVDRARDGRRDNEPRQQARRAPNRPAGSGANDRSGRRERSEPAGASDRSRTQSPQGSEARASTTDDGEATLSVVLVLLAVALAAIGGVLAGWAIARRGRAKPGGAARDTRTTGPTPNGGATGSKSAAGSTVGSSTEPNGHRDRTALGYVSVREFEAVDGPELRHEMAAIDAACGQRGLVLDEVVTDLEESDDTGTERPGLQYALRRLADGEASCLVVAELGRLSRSAGEVADIVDSLRQRNVRLVAIGDGLDTGTTSGAEAADKLVSLRRFDGEQRSPGATNHADPAYRPPESGNGRSRPPDYDVTAVKERIQAMRASGMTLQAIADRLNAENVPTFRGGRMWRPSGVQAAAGYRRPGRVAPEPAEGEPHTNGSSGGHGATSRPPEATPRGGGR